MIYTLILLSIAVLWRPSAEGKQYQYSQLQAGEGDPEMDGEFDAMEKNERGEAGDSDSEEEEDAGLDVNDSDLDSAQPHDTDEEPSKPPQKVHATFSISGDDNDDGAKDKGKPPTTTTTTTNLHHRGRTRAAPEAHRTRSRGGTRPTVAELAPVKASAAPPKAAAPAAAPATADTKTKKVRVAKK